MHEGSDVTVAAFGYSAIESLRAARALVDHGVSVEVLDMRVANPVDGDQTTRLANGLDD